MISAKDFEEAVLDLEGVRLVLRCPKAQLVRPYNYDRMSANNSTISEWLNARVTDRVDGVEVSVIDGLGGEPVRRMKMSTLRASYAE